MDSIDRCVEWGKKALSELENPRLEAEVLLCGVLDCDRVWLKTHSEEKLSDDQLFLYKKFIQKRARGIPVAYILGYHDFLGMRLEVNEDVLIPRDETEVLCGYALDEIASWRDSEKASTLKIFDVGTGSGAIACALANACKEWHVTCECFGIDVSNQALSVAKRNAKALNLDIDFLQSDLLEVIEEGSEWDVIVANLPYVPARMEISAEVQKEPALALFSGVDGLDHYRRLSLGLNKKSIQFKSLWIEFLPQQREKIAQIFAQWSVEFFEDVGGEVFFAKIA